MFLFYQTQQYVSHVFVGLNDVAGSRINKMIDNLKSKVSSATPAATVTQTPAATVTQTATTAGMRGGMFSSMNGGGMFSSMNGGGWSSELQGSFQRGNSGSPPAFQLTGESGYFPDEALGLNGYHMSGNANSASTAAAITSLNGGAFRGNLAGLDMSDYAD